MTDHLLDLKQNLIQLVNDIDPSPRYLRDNDHCDIVIYVGRPPNAKSFESSCAFLGTHSPYFQGKMMERQAKGQTERLVMVRDDLSPRVFEVMLDYVNEGKINLTPLASGGILDLLMAADDYDFGDLVEHIEATVFEQKLYWQQENCVRVLKAAFGVDSPAIFRSGLIALINDWPWWLYKCKNLHELDKDVLITMFREQNYAVREGLKLDILLRWGASYFPEIGRDPSHWTTIVYDALRERLSDCLSLIRFSALPRNDFYTKILPHRAILPRNISHDVLAFYLHGSQHRSEKAARMSRVRLDDSMLINHAHAAQLVDWIEQGYSISSGRTGDGGGGSVGSNAGRSILGAVLPSRRYRFNLLYRASRDQFSREVCTKNCDGRSPILIVARTYDGACLVGGYEPGGIPRGSLGAVLGRSRKSFIFSFGGGCRATRTVVARPHRAPQRGLTQPNLCFGTGDLVFDIDNARVSSVMSTFDEPILEPNEIGVDEIEVFTVRAP